MAEKIRCVCDNCGMESDVKFKKRKFNGNLEETFFKCGQCYTKYTCFITNPKVRKLIKENKKIRDKADKTSGDKSVLETNQRFIDEKMAELKIRYGE